MSNATESEYTREAFVAALIDYYDFIKKAYMPDHLFKYPPPGGWPELNRETLGFMGKDEIVIDTLRHIPYIEWPHTEPHEIYCGCAAIDYTSAGFKEMCIDRAANGERPDRYSYDVLVAMEDNCSFSSDVFWLAGSTNGRSGYVMVVDTARNTITLVGLEDDPRPTDLSEPDASEDGEEWKEYPTWKIKDFFQHLKDLFRSFVLLPEGYDGELCLTDHGHIQSWSPGAISLLQQHGWLSEGFDKDICMPKLYKLIKDDGDRISARYKAEGY